MTDYKKYINALRKCAKEHENDRTSMGHIIVSDLCRDTADLLEALEQESVLDKIKEEIKDNTYFINETTEKEGIDFETVEKIIDKYKAESEEVNGKA